MKAPKAVETIVVVDEKDKRLLTQVSSIRRPSLEEPVYQRGGPQILVFCQSGASLCTFILLACLAITVFVLLLTQSSANESMTIPSKTCIRGFFSAIGARHLLLVIVYFTYLSVFAYLLQLIERPRQNLMHRRQRLIALQQRHQFVANEILPALFNNTQLLLFVHGEKSRKMGSILLKALDRYEKLSERRCTDLENPFTSFDRALMFAFSSATTLGSSFHFQKSTTLTNHSKFLIIGLGLVGLLLTLLVVGDLASLLSRILVKQQKILDRLCRLILCFVPKRGVRPTTHIVQQKTSNQRQEPAFVFLLTIWSFWFYLGHLLMESLSDVQLSIVDLLWWFINAFTTTGLYKHGVNDAPLLTYLLIPYLLIGFSIMSLIFNCVCIKIHRLRATPISAKSPFKSKKKYDPVTKEEDQKALVVRDDTFSELNETRAFDESPIRSYHTVGIFQIESPTKAPERPNNHQEVATQTEPLLKEPALLTSRFRIPYRYSFGGHTSHDDVQSLIQETYRPLSTAQE